VRSAGYALKSAGFQRWRELLFASPTFQSSALHPFRSWLASVEESGIDAPEYGCEETQKSLAHTAITCPAIDLALIQTYLRRYAES
jgi:hypothetical protein